jgi:UDP-2,3-diacylglucosamine hydrolase
MSPVQATGRMSGGGEMIGGGYWPFAKPTRDRHSSAEPVGLVAGWGRFPILIAESLIRARIPVYCIAIHGHADKHLEYLCTHVCWSGVGRLGAHVRYFRRNRVKQVTMAGKLFKSDLLYTGSVWLKHTPDLECLRTFGPLLLSRSGNARDDSLLTAVTNMYSRHQMKVVAATDIAPELLAEEGLLAGRKMSPKVQRDIQFGWTVAKQMGALDIGQSITIKDGIVLAIEAIEGTDACIERTGMLCPRGGWTLVKVAKPSQDMRFDVPTIGPQTIEKVKAAGGTAIAIEAHRTIVVDREQTFADATRYGIALIAVSDASMSQPLMRAA